MARPEPVKRDHERKYYRVGIFCAEPQHHMEGEGGQRQESGLEPEVGVERFLPVHAHECLGTDADGEGQDQEDQLHVSSWPGHGVDGCHLAPSQFVVGVADGDGLAAPAEAVALGDAVEPGSWRPA